MYSKQAGLILILFVAAAVFCGIALNYANGQELPTSQEIVGACQGGTCGAESQANADKLAGRRYVLPYRHRHASPAPAPKKATIENECRRERKQPQKQDGPVDPVKNVAAAHHRSIPWLTTSLLCVAGFGVAYLATYKRNC